MLARLHHKLLLVVTMTILSCVGRVFGRQSVWIYNIDQDHPQDSVFPSYLFKSSFVSMSVLCDSYKTPDLKIRVQWALQEVHCMEQMYDANLKGHREVFYLEGELQQRDKKLSRKKMLTESDPADQNDAIAGSPSNGTRTPVESRLSNSTNVVNMPPMAFQVSLDKLYTCGQRSLLSLEDESNKPYRVVKYQKEAGGAPLVKTVDRPQSDEKVPNRVVSAWEDGMYHFLLFISPEKMNRTFHAKVIVQMHSKHGYLSAIDWPLLPFNGVMAFFYLFLTTAWIMVWARSHRHTLRIHVVMGVVAVAGSMAHTLQFIQAASENSNGDGVMLILWFAKILAVIQVSMFNLVVLIVSTGYGITTPTLARGLLVRMVVVCVIQFIVGTGWEIVADETLHLQYTYPTTTKVILWLKRAVVVVIDAWIMGSAIRTLLHLRQRNHSGAKVITFTVFMVFCTLIFLGEVAVFAISMGWMQACRTQWHWQWVFLSFTPMTTFCLLIVLMILWRPVDADQSYAFSPIGVEGGPDTDDDEEEGEEEENEIYSKETDKIKLEPL